jgi:hypothetical protein
VEATYGQKEGINSERGISHQELILIQDSAISANLEGVSLGEILQQIKTQTSICYRGTESLFKQKVSVQFRDLPLEDGVKRILAPFNYSLMFDADGGLAGMILLGRSYRDQDRAMQTTAITKRSSPQQPLEKETTKGSLEAVRTSSSPENPTAKFVIRHIIGEFHSLEKGAIQPLAPRDSQGSLSSSSPDRGKPSTSLGISRHMTNPMTDQ